MSSNNKVGETQSLCPICKEVIHAELLDIDGRVTIKKKCSIHGSFEDIYWGNLEHYKWTLGFMNGKSGVENPRTIRKNGCPNDCGICNEHKSHTVLGIIDITNRCNLRCPPCFANAGRSGYVYEPSKEQIRDMLLNLRNNKPVPTYAIQFSGGEPTLRDDLPELIEMAKELGFLHIEVNTNGIRFANDFDYAQKVWEAGANTIYLQFDGTDDNIYKKTRGVPLFEKKLKAIENWRKLNGIIVLVVTLIKGVNDHHLGEIIKFAVKNSDVVKCVNVQPISFSGKASEMDVKSNRITTYDFINLVEKQTNGKIKAKHFYPVPSVTTISRFVEAYSADKFPVFSTHPCCGVGTFLLTNGNDYKTINEIVDVDKFFSLLREMSYDLKKEKNSKKVKFTKFKSMARLFAELPFIIKDPKVKDLILDVLKERSYKATSNFSENALLIGCMHFMDAWNFDLRRVERCCIHYSLPNGKIIPFCSYNTLHREEVEREFAMKSI